MEVSQIVFLILTVTLLGAAALVVTTKNLFHAALYLIVSFFSVAGMYVLLEAGFFAAAQLLVYIGAISILFIFAVMLTRGTALITPLNSQAGAVGVMSAIMFAILAVFLWPAPIRLQEVILGGFRLLRGGTYGGEPWQFVPNNADTAAVVNNATLRLGAALGDFAQYGALLLLSGALLLVGVIGSIWVARERKIADTRADRSEAAADARHEAQLESEAEAREAAALPAGAHAASVEGQH